MTRDTTRRWKLLGAVLGAAVLVGAAVAVLLPQRGGPGNTPSPTTSSSPTTPRTTASATPGGSDTLVDPSVIARGWVPEPITRDRDVYVRAALAAAGTVDTRRATRAEWVSWLGTWFTPSPLYTNPQDAADQMAGYKADLAQSVVLPQQMWDSLARDNGRVTARIPGELNYLDAPDAARLGVWTASADVVMSYTRAAGGTETEYEETVRVSVQVVCDASSVPTAGSAQRPGDCKVVRYFDKAVG